MKRIPKLSMATITLATWLMVGQAGMAQTNSIEKTTSNGEPQQRTIDDAIELAGTHRTQGQRISKSCCFNGLQETATGKPSMRFMLFAVTHYSQII